jgi:hypothetical protein
MRHHDQPAPLGRHERFTIAHEIAHYLILNESAVLPKREAEYWLLEELCNRFASTLLIPRSLVAGISEPRSAAELADAVNSLARAAQVTAEPAARALVPNVQTPIATGTFHLDPLVSTKRLGFRGWWAENRPWWGGRGGRRLAVYVDHPLAPVLETMQAMRRGQTATPEIEGASSTLLRLRSRGTASFAAVLF